MVTGSPKLDQAPVHYERRQHEKIVAFSRLLLRIHALAAFVNPFTVQKRGFCPSCGARRMAESAAHLVDNVIPKEPVRQWVISFPIPLRILFAAQPQLLTPVLKVIHRAISTFLIKQAGLKKKEASTGAVTLLTMDGLMQRSTGRARAAIQLFGSAANLNIHLHCLFLDGKPLFQVVPPPTEDQLQKLLYQIMQRLMKSLTRQGFPTVRQGPVYRKLLINYHLYLRVVLAMTTDGKVQGYFEGVYRVDDATQEEILTEVLGALALVVITIFVTTALIYPVIIRLNKDLINFSIEQLSGNVEILNVLGSAIAKRDSDTNSHNYRVTLYSVHIAVALGMSSEQIRSLAAGAFLHDVGKIGIRDDILLKPGPLSDEEMRIMRGHVRYGLEIIAASDWLQCARSVVEYHHEKFDGSGYLKGLSGEAIPINARIFCIADVFDALTSKRPYKEAFGFDEAMVIMEKTSGTHFDPKIFDVFQRIALPLYQELNNAGEDRLQAMLNDLYYEHFLKKLVLARRRENSPKHLRL